MMTMAIDQYGHTYHIGNEPPRKYLLSHLGGKHCNKMYCDKAGGAAKHVGYIISGLWLTLYEVKSWEKEVQDDCRG